MVAVDVLELDLPALLSETPGGVVLTFILAAPPAADMSGSEFLRALESCEDGECRKRLALREGEGPVALRVSFRNRPPSFLTCLEFSWWLFLVASSISRSELSSALCGPLTWATTSSSTFPFTAPLLLLVVGDPAVSLGIAGV